ncbi:hypothetical protein DTO027B5_2444 [Paecilomyces variotii]|nr:hypothetical protein DTO169C6_2612 [Paecilomyces variotii]KAJ9288102.1 hypothetical protein DTO021C3_4275 [Paecilomyces variotii]KAJ9329028.1 hypothetical protein DTO027B3_428 [Paecilomyces variotii]KAJ9335851.1 hypothetical protein DTO027B5_2444 [Paecilomyces variotii]KAJ9370692.1 hypothetical protein DTO282E5_4668 [Paecilomyces variotii]
MEVKKHLVRPDAPFEATCPLSPADVQIPLRYIRKVFVYSLDQSDQGFNSAEAIDNLASRLKDSLKTFLRPLSEDVFAFPQLLGRVVEPENAHPYVLVDKSSAIRFTVVSRQDISFEDLQPEKRFPDHAWWIDYFATGLNLSEMGKAPNAPESFVVQLTSIRGGIVLTAQVSHRITDGYGFAGFIRRWFSRARAASGIQIHEQDLDKSLALAIHDRGRLTWDIDMAKAGTAMASVKKWEAHYAESANATAGNSLIGTDNVETKIFWMSNEKLEELRKLIGEYTTSQPTAFEAIVAFAWRCLSRVRSESNAHSLTKTRSNISASMFGVDSRRRLNPQLPVEYFGNATALIVARLPVSILSSAQPSAIHSVIAEVQNTLRNDTTDPNLRQVIQHVAENLKLGKNIPLDLPGYDFIFNSWEHLYSSGDELDLGIGTFRAVRYLMDAPITPSYLLILPSFGQRKRTPKTRHYSARYAGGLELKLNLPRYQMEKLENSQEWTHYVCGY